MKNPIIISDHLFKNKICHFFKERNENKKPKRKLSIEVNENTVELSEIAVE